MGRVNWKEYNFRAIYVKKETANILRLLRYKFGSYDDALKELLKYYKEQKEGIILEVVQVFNIIEIERTIKEFKEILKEIKEDVKEIKEKVR